MSLKSNILSIIYVALTTFLVCLYATGVTQNLMPKLGIPMDLTDISIAIILFVAGLLSVSVGADKPAVVIAGTIGAFIALTLEQSMIIKYMTLSAVLFSIGLYGMVVSRNAVRVLMCIELMLNAVNINLVTFARYIDPGLARGQLFAIFILTVAAAEAAVGLAIVLAIYRNTSTVDMDRFNLLKW